MVEFKLKQDYRAQNATIADDGYDNDLPKFKEFQAGQKVYGKIYVPQSREATDRFKGENIIVEDAFIIPKSILSGVGVAMPNALKANASMLSKGLGSQLREGAKSYGKGAMIGGILGLMTGLYFKKRVLLSVGVGVMAGGYIGYKMVEGTDTNGFILSVPKIK